MPTTSTIHWNSRGVLSIMTIVALAVLSLGMAFPLLTRLNESAAIAISTNNLRKLAQACQKYEADFRMLPHNGGCNRAEDAPEINYGWHHPEMVQSGTWITRIAPWIGESDFHRNNSANATSTSQSPAYGEKTLSVQIGMLLCAGRKRSDVKTEGVFQGPSTDFALNWFINAPPEKFHDAGWAYCVPTVGINGDWGCQQNRASTRMIADGASNTILLGGKALPPKIALDKAVASGDEGVMSPGDWKPPATRTSTGTARGHTVSVRATQSSYSDPPQHHAGYAWLYRDDELKDVDTRHGTQTWREAFGGPFASGVLFAFADGSVRLLHYRIRGTVELGRLLYPNDGVR